MKTFLITIPAMLLIACNGSHSNDAPTSNNKVKETETPEALQDKSSSTDAIIYSRKSSGSLVDELYQELVDKNPELQKIEDALVDMDKKVLDKKNEFNKYDFKSTQYYADADYKLNSITDSTLKRQMRQFVHKSQAAYNSKTAGLTGLLGLLDKGNATLDDHHTVLKIAATMPQIEQYQKDKMPANVGYYGLVKEQQQLDNTIQKNTPKH